MNDQPDTLEISQTMADIAESSQKLVADFLARRSGSAPGSAPGDLGSGKLKALCDAPGTYVKVRSG